MTSLGSERGQKRVIKSAHSHMTTANRKKIGQKKVFFWNSVLARIGDHPTHLLYSGSFCSPVWCQVRSIRKPFLSLSLSLSISLSHTQSLSLSFHISFQKFRLLPKNWNVGCILFSFVARPRRHSHAGTPMPARPLRERTDEHSW
jgi:hypothetical protein